MGKFSLSIYHNFNYTFLKIIFSLLTRLSTFIFISFLFLSINLIAQFNYENIPHLKKQGTAT